ncbi:hypothetical protein HYX58_00340 [Candidatus Dependentiae bacterium]|nr:hypothetical protein [Candidatus Dependentiae bacterium]
MKSSIARKSLLLLSIFSCPDLSGISMVYNFRIAQITKQPIMQQKSQKNHLFVALLFDQFRKKHSGVYQNYFGGLGSFIYDFKPYYFRTDFAASYIKEKDNGVVTFSGTETDDILFTLGRNFILKQNDVITLSGLFGVPTHKIYRLQHADFGYSQIGTGIQLDGAHAFRCMRSVMYGARYIYFVPRKAFDNFDQKHTFTLGNITDLLLAFSKDWQKKGVELGYTFRTRFGAHSSSPFDDIEKKTDYIRSNFYGVYKYKFSIRNLSNRFLFYGAYGFDHSPKFFGCKYIVTFWASWNLSF